MRAVRRSLDLNKDPQTAPECLSRVVAESNYSRLLLDIGELDLAAEHCELARTYADKAPTPRSDYVAA